MGLLDTSSIRVTKAMAGAMLAALFAVCIAMAVVPPTGPVMAVDDPALENLNTGDVAWIMASSAIVLLMTPGSCKKSWDVRTLIVTGVNDTNE
jgi:hypothetical protein